MALRMICLFCFVTLLPFPGLGLHTNFGELQQVPIRLTVINEFTNEQVAYSSSVIEGGVLFGALNDLQATHNGFKFTYTINNNFGIHLESVNGLGESDADQTYWELLSENGGKLTRLEIGIGCYQPQNEEHIILRFTTWAKKNI